jgi:flavin-dependent dehydrogenase
MDETLSYDVVVTGGAVAGASTAILLRRRIPGVRVLVVEKSDRFDWKVGESTVEVS